MLPIWARVFIVSHSLITGKVIETMVDGGRETFVTKLLNFVFTQINAQCPYSCEVEIIISFLFHPSFTDRHAMELKRFLHGL
jgi:hypothetical protein